MIEIDLVLKVFLALMAAGVVLLLLDAAFDVVGRRIK
jgi:hypothetical protein